MRRRIAQSIHRVRNKVKSYRYVPAFWWYHKHKFKITNTKFDISYCVFQESFVDDQYDIRRFLDSVKHADRLFFFDIGRNHGFVFYYMMYHIMNSGFKTSVIDYVGIDPSPLKFVYFNYFDFLRENNIEINYYLLDKAVAFGDQSHVKLKYGEDNFGNFNTDESNYGQIIGDVSDRLSFVEITVETIGLQKLKEFVASHKSSDAMIIKIDCKNQTTRLFLEMLNELRDYEKPYLVACEQDSSGDEDVSEYSKPGIRALTASNAFQ